LRLSAWLGASPDVWLGIQAQWDLWQIEQQPSPNIKPLERLAVIEFVPVQAGLRVVDSNKRLPSK
jgi:plasmid maintenance system antidote protein VapI